METPTTIPEQNDTNTLYVGNLPINTLDADIYRVFNTVGQLTSAKIIRPTNEQFNMKDTCYAYVSYRKKEEAAAAIKKLNHYELNGVQIRVMPCDKNITKQNENNVIIKNLPHDFDDKTLHQTFLLFGEIRSAKVATYLGKPLQYGYVQYTNKKDAKKAVKFGSGLRIGDNKIVIEKYEKKSVPTDEKYTNLYVKNFPIDIEEQYLRELLEKHGEISSFYMPRKETGEFKGFAFCCFLDHLSAKNAIDELHGKNLFDLPEPFYIQRAQPRNERELELRNSLAKMTIEGKLTKKNFYITNIPANYGEEDVRTIFSKYGNVVSVAVSKDSKVGDGTNFAYVCYSSVEEAEKLLKDASNVSLDGNKLNISIFKCKAERKIEKEREANSVLYNPKINVHSRMNSFFDKRSGDYEVDYRMQESIYKMVYSLAPSYEKKWGSVNATSREDFSMKVTTILLKKTKPEVRNMIELSSVLVDSVSNIVKVSNDEREKK